MAVHERAVLEFFHSRSIVPTRRLSLGNIALAGRSGRLLIAKVVARFLGELNAESEVDLDELLHLAENCQKIPQHRFGTDSRQTRSDWPAPWIDWSSPTDDCA